VQKRRGSEPAHPLFGEVNVDLPAKAEPPVASEPMRITLADGSRIDIACRKQLPWAVELRPPFPVRSCWLTGQDVETTDHFVNEVIQLPKVVECHLMEGDCDFILRIVAADLDDYPKFQIEHLGRIKGVKSIKTEIPMQECKLSSELPL